MNLNKGCIEITDFSLKLKAAIEMNLNKGCIEISQANKKSFLWKPDEP